MHLKGKSCTGASKPTTEESVKLIKSLKESK